MFLPPSRCFLKNLKLSLAIATLEICGIRSIPAADFFAKIIYLQDKTGVIAESSVANNGDAYQELLTTKANDPKVNNMGI